MISSANLSAAHPLSAGEFSTWLTPCGARWRGSGHGCRLRKLRRLLHLVVFHQGAAARNRNAEAHRTRIPQHCGRRTPGNLGHGLRRAGSLPEFAGGGCSIYPHRPDTCRIYDCRIFTAAGMNAGAGRSTINERIAHWRFEYASDDARREHRAVDRCRQLPAPAPGAIPGGHIPSRPADIAVLAVKAYTVFMDPPASDADAAAGIVAACRAFDQSGAA